MEEVVVFTDPFDKSIGLRPPQGHADVVFVSHDHHDHNNISTLKDEPVVIDAPGEYSVKGINVTGIDTWHDEKGGTELGRNTVFIIESEDIKICHLGDLGTDLDSGQLEMIDGIDVLFVPVGGKFTIDGKKAAEIVRKIEPGIVIPMHYKMKGTTEKIDDEKKFCSVIGTCPKGKTPKLNVKKKELEGKSLRVTVMNIE